jgi:alpha 1,3-glucosidase
MQPTFFKNTNSNYSYWIDMNEPSVFNIPGMTVPSDALHYTSEGFAIMHRDVHNMYGALQHKTAFEGMLERDGGRLRPFVLTRAYYFGSQKSGAYWTGDNRDSY